MLSTYQVDTAIFVIGSIYLYVYCLIFCVSVMLCGVLFCVLLSVRTVLGMSAGCDIMDKTEIENLTELLKNDGEHCKSMYTDIYDIKRSIIDCLDTIEKLEDKYKDNYIRSLLLRDYLEEQKEEAQ